MAIFTLKQKIFIVKRYYQCGNSTQVVQNEYPSEFCAGDTPTDDNINELINLFEEFGSVFSYRRQNKNDDTTTVPFTVIVKNPLEIDENYNCDESIKKEVPITDNGENDDHYNDIDYESDNKDDVTDIIAASVKYDVDWTDRPDDEVFVEDEDVPNNLVKVEISDLNDTETKSTITEELEPIHTNEVKRPKKVVKKEKREFNGGDRTYQCTECGTQFINMVRLKKHMVTHSDERPFSCDICQKPFKTRDRVREHKKIHLADRPVKCEICGKGFLHNGRLRKYMVMHTGEKPSVCSVCGKCFASNESLRVHNRTHTGEKPYKCSYCGKQFVTSGSLKNHVRIHTGEKPYKCQYCDKRFYESASCRVHERTHTGNYPYICKLCGKAHNHPSNLKSHMKHAHREDQS